MITMIVGRTGFGKTALMTKFAVDAMYQKARQAVRSSKRILRDINEIKGESYTIGNAKHLVFANYDIRGMFRGKPRRLSWDLDPFRLGFYDPDYPTDFFPPCSTFAIDEGARFFDSHMALYFAPRLARYIEMSRHNDYDIFTNGQRLMQFNPTMRELFHRIIDVLGIKTHEDNRGRIKRVEWICREYPCIESYEKKTDFEKVVYDFEGDIFRCYNSKSHRDLFFQGNEGREFTMVEGCREHDALPPDGYYISKKR